MIHPVWDTQQLLTFGNFKEAAHLLVWTDFQNDCSVMKLTTMSNISSGAEKEDVRKKCLTLSPLNISRDSDEIGGF